MSDDWSLSSENKNPELKLLKKIAKLDLKVFFDVGANEGYWTLAVLHYLQKAQVHCFEISSSTYQVLHNNIDSRISVMVNNFGLWDSIGRIPYKEYYTNSGHTTALPTATYWDKYGFEEMLGEVQTLDQYLTDNHIPRIDFLKIDTEGGEKYVLDGARGALEARSIRIIQFEYGYTNGDSHFLMKDAFEFFNSFGYCLAKLEEGAIVFKEFEYTDNDFRRPSGEQNWIAVMKDDLELRSVLEES